jgi:hypothetical protein
LPTKPMHRISLICSAVSDSNLSLLKIISERNNDAIRTELASRQWFRIVALLEVSVSL